MNNGEASITKISSQDVVEVEKISGMSDKKNSLVETKVMNEDKVNDEALSLQVVNDEIITMDGESMQEVIEEITSEDNVSIAGVKRTYSDEVEIEVSTPPKRACTTSSSEKGANDHTYCIKSPRRLRNQVNDLTDKIESLKKKVKSSKKKINRRDKKVSTLASVVSESKEKNLINSDCATILETTFSGVPRERTCKSWGVPTRAQVICHDPEILFNESVQLCSEKF